MLQQVLRGLEKPPWHRGVLKPGLRRGAVISVVGHIVVLVLVLVGLPRITPDEPMPEEQTVAMVFDAVGDTAMQAPTPAAVPAPAQDLAPPAPPVSQPPTPQPTEAAPPPPPPPPPPSPTPPTPEPPAPPAPTPPPPAPPAPTPPAPTPPTPAPPTPAPPTETAPLPLPPTPVPPPQPAPPTPAPQPPKPEPPLPLPPRPAPPPPPAPPSAQSATAQPNPTKNPAPNSDSVDNTLDKLRQMVRQSQPPAARPNPRAGGQPNSGGNPLGNDTAALTADQRGAIGEHVRACWTKDAGALDLDKQRVLLTVTTDAAGTARRAEVAGEDVARLSDPRFRAFAERAVRAVMDVRCANLPLPKPLLGRNAVLTFRFSP